MRRVLHLVGALEDNGGILSSIRGVASHATAEGWEHVLWMRRGFQQVRSPRLKVLESTHALGESGSHLRLLVSAACAWPGLRRLVREGSFDVVHGHSRGALLLSSWMSRTGRATIFSNHAYARRTAMYRRAASNRRLLTLLLTPNHARHYGITPQPGRVEILPECGAERFFEAPLPAARAASGGAVRLVGVGNLVGWKRWDLLVEACAALPTALRQRLRATIWGPIPDEPEARRHAADLERAVEARGLTGMIRFAGPTGDILGALRDADLFVLPSTNEPCSVALIEALAAGVPALVSASGGNVDLVRDGETGRLFEPGSAKDLASKLEEWMTGRVKLVSPERIRQSVERCRASVVARQLHEIYRRWTGRA
jgi:glycosyltransferase involved in cell wall biosynthesis